MIKIITTKTYKELLQYKAIAKAQDIMIDTARQTMIQASERIDELELKLHTLTAKNVIIKSKKTSKKTNAK